MDRYGVGIISYFSISRIVMLFLFAVMLMFYSVMQQYAKWQNQDDKISTALHFSMGNLGESSMKCVKTKLISDFTYLSCDYGTI